MFERYRKEPPTKRQPTQVAAPPAVPDSPDTSRITNLKVALHQRLLESLNLSALEKMQRSDVAVQIAPLVKEMLDQERVALNAKEYSTLLDEILDEFLGLGPLEPFLKDSTVSDILVNTYKQVFVERRGRLEKTQARFKDDDHLVRIIQKIVAGVGRRVDESQPWVDARLPDGSRVNALLPPCAVDGPLLSIRKFAKIPYTMELLIENGTLTPEMALLMQVAVRSRHNILISGGTGTGKTTFLNALSSYIDNRERVVTIEDTAELQLQQEHVGRMETRPPNLEGKGEVTQRDLVRNALRMRPDRIIVGEVRGPEVIDMLQAMNTGHDGSMTTVHANSPRDALTRLEHMVSLSGLSIPPKDLRLQMSSALDLVIQIQRFMDGRRRVVSIQEIVGMEGDIVSMQEIYTFRRRGVDAAGNVVGEHAPTGIHARLAERAAEYGLKLPDNMFITPEMSDQE